MGVPARQEEAAVVDIEIPDKLLLLPVEMAAVEMAVMPIRMVVLQAGQQILAVGLAAHIIAHPDLLLAVLVL